MDASPDRDAGVAPTVVSRLEFDIEWPPKHAAAYLVEEPGPILIDAGNPDDRAEVTLLETLATNGYEPADVEAVVVTHPHSDHIGQVPLLRDAGVSVYAPEPVLEQLDRDEDDLADGVRTIARSAGCRGEAIERELERARRSLRRNRWLLDPDGALPVAFGEPFTVAGLEFEAVHTPGHQIHHASLVTTLGGEQVLFSGDALIDPFRAAALHAGLDYEAYDAVDAFRTAMDRLEDWTVDRVFPGHGPAFTDADAAIENTRSELATLTRATRDAVEAIGPATPIEITRRRVGESRHPAQLLDTIGALGSLERRGQVAFESRDGARYYRSA